MNARRQFRQRKVDISRPLLVFFEEQNCTYSSTDGNNQNITFTDEESLESTMELSTNEEEDNSTAEAKDENTDSGQSEGSGAILIRKLSSPLSAESLGNELPPSHLIINIPTPIVRKELPNGTWIELDEDGEIPKKFLENCNSSQEQICSKSTLQFFRPDILIKYKPPTYEESIKQILYDLEEDDIRWFQTKKQTNYFSKLFSEDDVECMIDLFERHTGLGTELAKPECIIRDLLYIYDVKQPAIVWNSVCKFINSNSPVTLYRSTFIVENRISLSDLVLTFSYWRDKRLSRCSLKGDYAKCGKPLVMEYEKGIELSNTDPTLAFRSREKEKFNKRHKFTDKEILDRLVHLRNDFMTLRQIFELIYKREKLKQETYLLEKSIVQQGGESRLKQITSKEYKRNGKLSSQNNIEVYESSTPALNGYSTLSNATPPSQKKKQQKRTSTNSRSAAEDIDYRLEDSEGEYNQKQPQQVPKKKRKSNSGATIVTAVAQTIPKPPKKKVKKEEKPSEVKFKAHTLLENLSQSSTPLFAFLAKPKIELPKEKKESYGSSSVNNSHIHALNYGNEDNIPLPSLESHIVKYDSLVRKKRIGCRIGRGGRVIFSYDEDSSSENVPNEDQNMSDNSQLLNEFFEKETTVASYEKKYSTQRAFSHLFASLCNNSLDTSNPLERIESTISDESTIIHTSDENGT